MLETAVAVDRSGLPLYWHCPMGRSSAFLPDSRTLWDVMWTHRGSLLGVAHTHPGSGPTRPSWTDLTTFAAVEAALGKRLIWWIASETHLAAFSYIGPGEHDYARCTLEPGDGDDWLDHLRDLSYDRPAHHREM
jgi:hypothetical protein